MTDKIEKEFTLGGNIDQALNGNYKLSVNEVLREAFTLTYRHFLFFFPAIAIFLIISAVIFYIAINLQGYDLDAIGSAFTNSKDIDFGAVQAIFIGVFSAEVICSPLLAGLGLMAMSHAAGLKTKPAFLLKGFQFTIPVIVATLINLVVQAVSSSLFQPLSLYFSLAFAHAILLICEKRMRIHQALLISLKATNKKLFPLLVIFTLTSILLVFAFISSGIGLLFVLPFYMHVKGVLYRTMFGIKLTVITTSGKPSSPQFFDA